MTIVQDMLPAVGEFAYRVDWLYILKTALLIAAAVCVLGGVLRLILGRGSSLVRSVSACVTLVLVYLTAIILYVLIAQLRGSIATLPFITVTEDAFCLWDIRNLDNTSLLPSLLQLFILAFLINLTESLLPHGKKFLSWYGFRLLTVAICLVLYSGIDTLIRMCVPQVYGQWAGYILLGLWIFIALTAILKVLMGIVLTVINPIVGVLYTFFFSNIFGKQLTKAILTTLLSVGLLTLLYRLGLTSFAFNDFSVASYGPTCLIALLALYLFGKML